MKIGLVLEGGGMRGLYTNGVLDCMMDNDWYPDYVIGVSAGACSAVSYISGQRGRSYRINTGYLGDKRYVGLDSFIKTKSMFGMDFIFDEIPNRLDPFDYKAFLASPIEMVTGVTDIETGMPVTLTNRPFRRATARCGGLRRQSRAFRRLYRFAADVTWTEEQATRSRFAARLPMGAAALSLCSRATGPIKKRPSIFGRCITGCFASIRGWHARSTDAMKFIMKRLILYGGSSAMVRLSSSRRRCPLKSAGLKRICGVLKACINPGCSTHSLLCAGCTL